MATFSKRKTTGFENQSRDIHYHPPPRGKRRGKGKIGHKPLENNKKTVTTSNH